MRCGEGAAHRVNLDRLRYPHGAHVGQERRQKTEGVAPGPRKKTGAEKEHVGSHAVRKNTAMADISKAIEETPGCRQQRVHTQRGYPRIHAGPAALISSLTPAS